jgi:hypothetical protein
LHERFKIGCSRSFYNATVGFEHEWMRSDNIFLARKEFAPIGKLYDEHYAGPVVNSKATAHTSEG